MKRGKKMILLVGAFCALLGGYSLLGQMNETTTVSETKGNYPLWIEEKTVSSLAWTQDGEALSFSMGESVWMKADDAAFPVNQTAARPLDLAESYIPGVLDVGTRGAARPVALINWGDAPRTMRVDNGAAFVWEFWGETFAVHSGGAYEIEVEPRGLDRLRPPDGGAAHGQAVAARHAAPPSL